MAPTLIGYSFTVAQGAWARAWLNDLPLYRAPGPMEDSRSGGAVELCIPGENTVRLEVLEASLMPGQSATLELYQLLDPNADPSQAKGLCSMAHPRILDELQIPQAERQLPFEHEERFVLDPFDFTPSWLSVPAAEFGPEGTAELREAVRAVHAAVDSGDVDGFLDLIALKLEDTAHAYPSQAHATVPARHELFRELFALKPRPRKLDFRELRFDARRGGRVAHVYRTDGGPALEAVAELDPAHRLKADLLLAQVQGSWRVVG